MSDLYDRLLGVSDRDGRFFGLVTAVVTNNKDPDGLGRVKLALGWLDDGVETDWARVAAPMAGAGRGTYFLPEVDDEVLVGFEHGNPAMPYVLGSLWNGKDKPPESNADGKNDVRSIKSRSGHMVRFTDKNGAETIEVIDKSGKNSIVISTKDRTVTISADADVVIKSSTGKVRIEGKSIAVQGDQVEIVSKGSAKVEAGGILTVKGQMVNIN